MTDPGGGVDVRVLADSGAFADWHRGALSWSQAAKEGRITLTGDRPLVKAFPSWNTRSPVIV